MRVIHHNGRATPLRHPLWDTGQTRRAHLRRITPHIPHRTDNIIIPHDGSKTVHRPLRCLRHYTMSCSARPIGRPPLLVPATSNSSDKPATSPSTPKPPTLSLCMDLIRQARRHFRGVGRRTFKGLASGIPVNPTPIYQTEALSFLRDRLVQMPA